MIECKFEDGGEGKLRHICVHAIVVRKEKILLVKRSEKIIEGGKWAFPGGFVDRDETIQEAALRELKEETGWDGKVIAFFRINSNPHRANDAQRQNIPIEFLVEPLDRTGTPDWEQTEVVWHDMELLTPEMMAFDHYKTIELLRKYLEHELTLPIVE